MPPSAGPRAQGAPRGLLSKSGGALWRLGEALAALGALILLLQWAFAFSILDGEFWRAFLFPARGQGPLVRGFLGTLGVTALVIPLGLAFGFFWGWAQLSRWRVLAWPSTVLVEFLRGVPAVILIIFAYFFGSAFIPRSFDVHAGGILVATIALGLHTGAYQAEIFRAGFQSVPRGQVEAAAAVGMSAAQAMAHVVLPQSLRLALPPLGNEFANAIKDTALLAAIGSTELFATGLEFQRNVTLGGHPSWLFLIWISVAAAYFLITFAVTRGVRLLERRVRVPGMEGAAA